MLYVYTVYSRYNTDWIANTEMGLDPNNSVKKRLWCNLNALKADEDTEFTQTKRNLTCNMNNIESLENMAVDIHVISKMNMNYT